MEYYICTDIGGTNMTVGLFRILESEYAPVFKLVEYKAYLSQDEAGIAPGLSRSIEYFMEKYQIKETPPINISACGPTDGISAHPTNLPQEEWYIDARELSNKFQTQVFLINDFSAIAYGLMTVGSNNDEKIFHIPNTPTANFSLDKKSIKVALGAGTGLGCATICNEAYKTNLISSEAGWLDYAPNIKNQNEVAYAHYLADPSPEILSARTNQIIMTAWEDAICASRGINNIYDFFCSSYSNNDIISKLEQHYLIDRLGEAPANERPSLISSAAHSGNKPCRAIMDFWITLYSRYARQIALTSIPTGGLFLGGGAASKNISFFTEKNLFQKVFVSFDNKNILEVLKSIPIYIITEYLLSLYGNAYHLFHKTNNK